MSEPVASAVLDIGAGTTQAAVISLGGIVSSKVSIIAGDDMDLAIVEEIKKNHNLLIGERTAEDIKIYLGLAEGTDDNEYMVVKGRDLVTGMPSAVKVGSDEICEALRPIVHHIGEKLKQMLEETPPELTVDIIEKGIALTGGIAQLKNLDTYLSRITGVNCYVSGNPQLCVVNGMNKMFCNLKLMKAIMNNSDK